MKINSKIIDEVSEKISSSIPSGLKAFSSGFENNCKAILKASFERLNLVTREEFEIQRQVLLKTREKIEQLEKKVDTLLKQNNIEP